MFPASSAGLSSTFWQRAIPIAVAYRGHTSVAVTPRYATVRFAPNLAREQVRFSARLREPIAVREAMAMLRAVVVDDQAFRPDRTAYRAYRERIDAEEREVRAIASAGAAARVDAVQAALSPDERRAVDAAHGPARKRYWALRNRLEQRLRLDDPALFRLLVPLDPVVTVAPDALLFEAFSQDTSSYGCVVIDRGAFTEEADAALGTTNVDFSTSLAGELERLRSYRDTRLHIDPEGIAVQTDERPALVEEKIDVPVAWLRGYAQLSSLALLPSLQVRVPAAALRTVLAHLARHREKTGPRALRFHLTRGQPVRIELEPWGLVVDTHGPVWDGADEVIPVWGRRRLLSLERLLPLAFLDDEHASVEVRLLGRGLPSLWTVRAGPVRVVLALSGWSRNDWSSEARLDLLGGAAVDVSDVELQRVASQLQRVRTATIDELERGAADAAAPRAAIVKLCRLGQAVVDVAGQQPTVRYRALLDPAQAVELVGDEPAEVRAGKALGKVDVDKDVIDADGLRELHADISGTGSAGAALWLDRDDVIRRARCGCSHFHRFGLKQGPCRHLLALRLTATSTSIATGGAKPGALH